MSQYRHNLPQLSRDFFLTDSGLETFLYFQQGEFRQVDAGKAERGCRAAISPPFEICEVDENVGCRRAPSTRACVSSPDRPFGKQCNSTRDLRRNGPPPSLVTA